MMTGTFTAIVTPFKEGALDESALAQVIQTQIRAGVAGIVPAGTTGESPTLDYDEHLRLIELSVRFAKKKIKVIAGTGANSTKEAVFLTQEAEKAGADASLQVAPYYNKPTQEGLYAHFRAVARSTRLPIILYSIPSRCGIEIAIPTIQKLTRDCRNIVGLKESGGNPDRVSQLYQIFGKEFFILSGDDSMTLPFMAVGAQGVISVASNVIPREIVKMVRAFLAGRSAEALRLHSRYFSLFKNLFVETNPIPVKGALAMLGQLEEEYRLPLVPMNPRNRDILKATLKECGILKR